MTSPQSDFDRSQLNEAQLDLLRELINIGVGRAAALLNQVTSAHVELQVPDIRMIYPSSLEEVEAGDPEIEIVAIHLGFNGSFNGTAALVFSPQSASRLVSIMVGDATDFPDLDSLRIGALEEVGNIVLNAVMGSLGNMLAEHIDYLPPDFFEDRLGRLYQSFDAGGPILVVRTSFIIESQRIEGDVFIFFQIGAFDNVLCSIDRLLADGQN